MEIKLDLHYSDRIKLNFIDLILLVLGRVIKCGGINIMMYRFHKLGD